MNDCNSNSTEVDIGEEDNSIYIANGYENRADYLQCLAEDYGVDIQAVYLTADLYGPEEEFDGLVAALEDMANEQTI